MLSCSLFYGVITFASFWVGYVEAAQISLNGKILQMAADHWDPWFITPEVSGLPSYSGVMWKILDYLEDSMNFSTVITRSADGSWGSPDENGVWGGMVGMVKRNEVDFALGPTRRSHFAGGTCCKAFFQYITGPFSFNLARSQVVQYTLPVYTDNIIALMPFKRADDHSIIFRPFEWRVWVGIGLVLPIFILITVFSNWIYFGHCDWWKQIEFTSKCICMEGGSIPKAQYHNMIYSLTWIWCSFILFAAYSGVTERI